MAVCPWLARYRPPSPSRVHRHHCHSPYPLPPPPSLSPYGTNTTMKFELAKRVANSGRRRCLARAFPGGPFLFCNCIVPKPPPVVWWSAPGRGGAGRNFQQGRRAGTDKIKRRLRMAQDRHRSKSLDVATSSETRRARVRRCCSLGKLWRRIAAGRLVGRANKEGGSPSR
jgi:hypothetical protein